MVQPVDVEWKGHSLLVSVRTNKALNGQLFKTADGDRWIKVFVLIVRSN